MSDESFHEIQLNGKQLVFLFMAATVVSVVIFLCGVMVGRGVQSSRGASGESLQAGARDVRPVEPARGGEPVPGAPPADEPTPVEDDYYDRLVEGTPTESLAPPADARRSRTEPPRTASAPAPRPTTPPPAAKEPATARKETEKPAATASADPPVAVGGTARSGYAVQLAALRERSEADAIARRLVAKGYQAYVLVPPAGAPPVYRVQVGRFDSRGEADRVAARLRKEERFDPWVTR